jgi:hypothetical protein
MEIDSIYITAACIATPVVLFIWLAIVRRYGRNTVVYLDDESSDDEENDESSSAEDVWEPGSATLELTAIRNLVCSRFPDMTDVFAASGGLSDARGINTSDVDLVKIDNDHQAYETTFGEYLTRIKAANAKHPNRTMYQIIFPEYPDRYINICVTSDRKQGMRAVAHRANELMLNKYGEIAIIAMYLMKYKGLNTEEAWCEVLCLKKTDDFDPFEAMLRDDLEPLAKTMNDELIEIYNRI